MSQVVRGHASTKLSCCLCVIRSPGLVRHPRRGPSGRRPHQGGAAVGKGQGPAGAALAHLQHQHLQHPPRARQACLWTRPGKALAAAAAPLSGSPGHCALGRSFGGNDAGRACLRHPRSPPARAAHHPRRAQSSKRDAARLSDPRPRMLRGFQKPLALQRPG